VNQDSHEERLRSAVDAIVPADGFPSASQAGCLRFWDAMLAGERPEWWRRVGAVLDLLDVAAGGSFPELDQEQQHGVLERLAADPDYVWFASMTNYAFMPSQQHGRCWAGDQVGRHLQGHLYGGSLGIFDDPVNDYVGPGPSIATNDFRHFNAGLVGGAMIANEFVPTPIGAFCYLRDARTAPTAWSGGQGRDATSDLSNAAGSRPRHLSDGTDPGRSVIDSYGRVWGHENLRVVDGLTHVTNGGVNPVLTIMRTPFRVMHHWLATEFSAAPAG
jgi:hypothetical protein